MCPTLEQLVSVRSGLAVDLQQYYRDLAMFLDQRYGGGIRIGSVAVRPVPDVPPNPGQWGTITGEPGIGKSFLAAAWCAGIIDEAEIQCKGRKIPLGELALPIFVDVRRVAKTAVKLDPVDEIMRILETQYEISARLAHWMRDRIDKEQCWLFFDSLDQVPTRDKEDVDAFLGEVEARRWNSRLIVACCNSGHGPWSAPRNYPLDPLDRKQILNFIDLWFFKDRTSGAACQAYFHGLWAKAHPTASDRDLIRLAGIPRELGSMCYAYRLAKFSPGASSNSVWRLIYQQGRAVRRRRLWLAAGCFLMCAAVLSWPFFGRLTITNPGDGDTVPHACEIRGRRPVWQSGIVVLVRAKGEDRWWNQGECRETVFGHWETKTPATFGREDADVGREYEIVTQLGDKTSRIVTVTRQ